MGENKLRRTITSIAVVLAACTLLVWLATPGIAQTTQKPRLAAFGMEFHDSSHEGELNGVRADETKRLALVSAAFLQLLERSGRYEIIDLADRIADIEAMRPVARCNGCEIDMAKGYDADLSTFGIVHKVSNLILEIHIYVRDVRTAKVVKYARAAIRGNDDRSWLRGLRWLVEHKLLADEK